MKRWKMSLGAVLCAAGVMAQDKPNLIFLMADDQASWTLGCYGNPDVQTPNLDQLARDGVTFDHHYDTTAICMASRATVMSGMFEYKTGCNFHHGKLSAENWSKTYPSLLHAAGYRTAFAGKFGFLVTDDPTNKKGKGYMPEDDFSVWAGGDGQTSYKTSANEALKKYAEEYPHSTLAYGAFGSDFVRESVGVGEPFCLSISFKAPHRPTQPDPRFNGVYEGKTFSKPANFGRENGLHFSKQSQMGRQYPRFEEWNYATNYDGVMAKYHQQVYGIDVAVGMIRAALKESGADKNTVIIYTSDNGFLCGSHGYGSKVLPYEEASRVPMIIYDPRHSNSGKGLRSSALTGNVDFAPTLLNLAGLPAPGNMDGANLMKLYDNPAGEIHGALSLMNAWGAAKAQALSVVTRTYKYIYWYYGGEGFEPTEELYHIGRDPLEMTNLAHDPEQQAVLEMMRKKYDSQLNHWKEQGVDYSGYTPYETLFERTLPWSEKASLVQDMDDGE
ncbi:sulfatase family protein [Pontiella sulfatireligans]|uniref:Arylsulfatase n=1 Tax=Pontiella sulfatireligans TaxID=2750658 RepID=A0A6C2UFA0_9BACT|nr:sulfatase [Pontiella sulfatireligans]SPS74188.1 sulfatase S1_25 [Kiritimatiellales bacterium]VGO18553.1 Arylsulfatase [Pontiella sulfatireligans]